MTKALTPQRFTVLGGSGFVGSHLVSQLRARGHDCFVPGRKDDLPLRVPLGHVIYCIGLTADFRSRPFDTVEAHTALFSDLLRQATFDSLLYLSTARIYQNGSSGSETASFTTNPGDPMQLYDLTKMTAECLCLSLDRPEIRIVRLSNVYGPDFASDNFLISVIRDAVTERTVRIRSHLESAKDYVRLEDVVDMLERISLEGRERVYNVASGRNVSNQQIAEGLSRLTGCQIEWVLGAAKTAAPPIAIDRLQNEFGYAPRQLETELSSLIALFSEQLAAGNRAPAVQTDS